MQTPMYPENEPQRLRALRALALLDTPAEARFERLTRLAAQLFDVPMALVSLVDEKRQWFKSKFGVDVCETARDISFCGHAILEQDIFEVSDAHMDERFADNPLVLGAPYVRFYAAAPLVTIAGYCIGTLCIIDRQPRQLNEAQRRSLRDLADMAILEIEQLELRQQDRELKKSRRLAEIITRVQLEFIREQDRRRAFDDLLTDVLDLTESEYGFIGEVLFSADGQPYLKTYAITNIAWNDATRDFYAAHAPTGLEFYNLKTLFGAALTSGQPVIANDPYHDPRRGGLPDGHPALNTFLGVPVHHGGQLVAMLGIANCPKGYDQALIDFLSPLLLTLGQLIVTQRAQQLHHQEHLQLERTAAALRCSEARLRGLFELSPIGIALNDYETGQFIEINAALLQHTGYERDELIHLSDGHITPKEYNEQEALKRASINQTGRYGPYEKEYIRKDGSRYPVLLNGMVLNEVSGEKLIWSMIEDISDRKRNERMKNEFISTVSHELRTPLTGIAGSLSLILGGVTGNISGQMREMLEIAHKNSQRLSHLVNDLLDMEKLLAGKMRFEMQVQALMPLVEQSINNNQAYAQGFDVYLQLVSRADVLVNVDALRLQQIMANLLSNAAKFSPKHSEVALAVTHKSDSVLIAVSDQGPGIPESFQQRIFEKFSQADASDSRPKGGTGLGLSITRELVERMGGKIGFYSVPGHGATFYVELPVIRA